MRIYLKILFFEIFRSFLSGMEMKKFFLSLVFALNFHQKESSGNGNWRILRDFPSSLMAFSRSWVFLHFVDVHNKIIENIKKEMFFWRRVSRALLPSNCFNLNNSLQDFLRSFSRAMKRPTEKKLRKHVENPENNSTDINSHQFLTLSSEREESCMSRVMASIHKRKCQLERENWSRKCPCFILLFRKPLISVDIMKLASL